MVSNKCIKKNKEGGFTIIEMLVVTLILVLISVALAAIIRGLVTSSTRIKRLQTVRAQTQETIHYLTKELRMSEFSYNSGNNSITFSWRKATEDNDYYKIEEVTLNEASINSFFSKDWAGIQTGSLQFIASGNKEGEEGNDFYLNNRVVIKFNIRVLTSATDNVDTDSIDGEEVIIPVQTMVSLRSYNLGEEEEVVVEEEELVVTTWSETNLGETTVTLNGEVTSDGGFTVTERGFYCDTNTTPTTKYTVAGTTGHYTKDLTSLEKGTKYYFKAFATNEIGTVYGKTLDFTTEEEEVGDPRLTWPGSNHHESDCTNLTGGTVHTIVDSGITFCRYPGSVIPDGWFQADNWQKYSQTGSDGDECGNCEDSAPIIFLNEIAHRYTKGTYVKLGHGCSNIGWSVYVQSGMWNWYNCTTYTNPTAYRVEIGIW